MSDALFVSSEMEAMLLFRKHKTTDPDVPSVHTINGTRISYALLVRMSEKGLVEEWETRGGFREFRLAGVLAAKPKP